MKIKGTRPTLGLMPFKLHSEMRLEEIKEAIKRYVRAGKEIPKEWIAEKQTLEARIKSYE